MPDRIAAVLELDVELLAALDDVVVGQDPAVAVEDDAGADAGGRDDADSSFPRCFVGDCICCRAWPGIANLMIALCITGWVSYARLTRGQTLSLRNRQHVQAAESLGASVPRLLFKHILPLLGSILIVEATYSLASIMIAEASLSFLGLGIQAPNASWGAMLRDGVRYMLVAPHYVLIVGLSLMSLILAINLLGDQLA